MKLGFPFSGESFFFGVKMEILKTIFSVILMLSILTLFFCEDYAFEEIQNLRNEYAAIGQSQADLSQVVGQMSDDLVILDEQRIQTAKHVNKKP